MTINIRGHRGRGRSGRPVDWRPISFPPSDPVKWQEGNIARGEIHVPIKEAIQGNEDVRPSRRAGVSSWPALISVPVRFGCGACTRHHAAFRSRPQDAISRAPSGSKQAARPPPVAAVRSGGLFTAISTPKHGVSESDPKELRRADRPSLVTIRSLHGSRPIPPARPGRKGRSSSAHPHCLLGHYRGVVAAARPLLLAARV